MRPLPHPYPSPTASLEHGGLGRAGGEPASHAVWTDHLLVVDSFPENDLMKRQSISPPPETAFQGNPGWMESMRSMTALAPRLGLFTGVLAYDSAQDISSFLLSPGGSRIHHHAEILKMTTIYLPQPRILKECAEGAQYFPGQCSYSALEGLFQGSPGRANKRGRFLKTQFLSPNPLGTCLTV